MLRNRSRAVTSKQSLMSDHSSQSSPSQKRTRPIPSFFGSPRFKALIAKGLSETEATMSPTSILETPPFSPFGSPFSYERNQPKSPKVVLEKKHSWDKMDSKGIGLALIDTLNDGSIEENCSKPSNGKVLFGTKLRVQIPPLPASTVSPTVESPKSPADLGIKTRNSQISAFGPASSGIQTKESPRVVTAGSLSVTEMELSEDYTCVISHGPNPKTTHIFDNCIVETYCSLPDEPNSMLENFLSFCYTCKKNLEQTKDIYIYRGEKAFCSRKCRYQEMLLDGVENSEFDDAHKEFS
ncbi:FCS-Like Zinc finger 8-like [Quercus robur]|uniref:FLZ-type domain-containing protein n=1 Tax=Quercus lobata TaxID=97700 RepID=A0A7N2N3N7_QUELO|nr:FCS-Like Zinc finger 8-like [Quercus lobata]XP_030948474.1 FCS-Like Zinc finger 8-like [Quercus lobata]XP_050264777.1 FCS-Like Zinc finger 8-like [Quercus robur]